jgi:hypothetical protein
MQSLHLFLRLKNVLAFRELFVLFVAPQIRASQHVALGIVPFVLASPK